MLNFNSKYELLHTEKQIDRWLGLNLKSYLLKSSCDQNKQCDQIFWEMKWTLVRVFFSKRIIQLPGALHLAPAPIGCTRERLDDGTADWLDRCWSGLRMTGLWPLNGVINESWCQLVLSRSLPMPAHLAGLHSSADSPVCCQTRGQALVMSSAVRLCLALGRWWGLEATAPPPRGLSQGVIFRFNYDLW